MDYLIFVMISSFLFFLSTFAMKYICGTKPIHRKTLMGGIPHIVWGLLVVLYIFGWFRVDGVAVEEKEKIIAPLVGLAPIFAHFLEMMDHQRITLDTPAGDPHYQHLLDVMEQWMQLYPSMESIYTLRKLPDENNIFILDPEVDYDQSGRIDSALEKVTPIGRIYPERLSELEQAFQGKVTFQEHPYTDEWGTWISSFAPIRDPQGKVEAVLGIDFDYGVWEERIAEARLRHLNHLLVPFVLLLAFYWMAFYHRFKGMQIEESEKRYRDLIEQSPEAIAVHDDYKILYMNRKGLELCGVAALEDVVGQSIFVMLHPDHHEEVREYVRYMYETKKPLEFLQLKLIHPNGELLYIETSNLPILFNGKRAIQVVFRDVTEKKRMEAALEQREQQYRFIAEYSTDIIAHLTADAKYLYVSPVIENILGYSPNELIGRSPFSLIHPEDRDELIQTLRQAAVNPEIKISAFTFRMLKKDGEYIWVETTARSIRDEEGGLEGILTVTRDITKRKLIEEKLRETNEILQKLSSVDGLTGIANRRYFDEFLLQEWARAVRHRYPLSLIMFDIDCFKKFNDTYGHQKGDKCLQKVAKTLSATFKRSTDLVARYGGEEFAVILPNTGSTDAYRLAEKLRMNIERMQIPHQASDVAEFVTVSVGVATILPDVPTEPSELIEQADLALYQAKRAGRNRVSVVRGRAEAVKIKKFDASE